MSGPTLILGATVIAGVAAYAVTLYVPAVIGLADYATFSIFWSFLYLLVGALIGIQQEVTRATRLRKPGGPPETSRARNFALVTGLLVGVAIVMSAPVWVDSAFPDSGWGMVWPLAVGAAFFVIVAVVSGTLYGVESWGTIAFLIAGDALLRMGVVLAVLIVTTDPVALAWAVALPFPLTLVLAWWTIRKAVVGKTQLDVHYRSLSWNVARTILASACSGILISGFPLLLGVTSPEVSDDLLGLYILTITVTRAPLIIVTMSFQSYFVIHFRDAQGGFWRLFGALQLAVLAAGAVIAGLAWVFGPAVFAWLYPDERVPDGAFLAVLAVSSSLVAALAISAPAVLARSQHVVYTSGWLAAAVATVCALLLPLDFALRVNLAILAGPVAGLLVTVGYLLLADRRAQPTKRTNE
ncbi:MAG: hypothetical protein B7Y93_00380 [Micrococcales bacterium 32-70-13]|nr:MAG: hypothetical protein B7Y93_00380 [Micrococcales bacterium 32-70-13]